MPLKGAQRCRASPSRRMNACDDVSSNGFTSLNSSHDRNLFAAVKGSLLLEEPVKMPASEFVSQSLEIHPTGSER